MSRPSFSLFEMEIEWLPVQKLFCDFTYQRKKYAAHINRMVREFDERAFQPLHVARRKSGKHYIVDGWQRYNAVKMMGWEEVPCVVFPSKGQKWEAETFGTLNKGRLTMSPQDAFRAALAAGSKMHHLILEACKAQHVVVNCNNDRTRRHDKVNSVGELIRAYKMAVKCDLDPSKHIQDVCFVIRRGIEYDVSAFNKFHIGALSYILAMRPRASKTRLIEVLKELTCEEIKGWIQGGGGGRSAILVSELCHRYDKLAPNSGKLGEI